MGKQSLLLRCPPIFVLYRQPVMLLYNWRCIVCSFRFLCVKIHLSLSLFSVPFIFLPPVSMEQNYSIFRRLSFTFFSAFAHIICQWLRVYVCTSREKKVRSCKSVPFARSSQAMSLYFGRESYLIFS